MPLCGHLELQQFMVVQLALKTHELRKNSRSDAGGVMN